MKRKIKLRDIVSSRCSKPNSMIIKIFHFNPIEVNTYVLYDETKQCLIIDPGNYIPEEDQQLADFIEREGLQVQAVVNTHPHIDHIAGNRFCKEHFGCPILMHENALKIYGQAHVYSLAFGVPFQDGPAPDKLLKEGDVISFGNQSLQVLYTPGHADGSICLHDEKNACVFVGDVLFAGSVGRCDLPTGSMVALLQNIKEKLLVLPSATVVYCGHGLPTTLEEEKLNNPFIQ